MARDPQSVAILTDYLAEELAVEAARKAGVETRAIALVTVNFTAITLYLAISSAPSLNLKTGSGWALGLGVAGYVAIFLCLLAAVIALFPLNYKRLELAAIGDTLEDINDGIPSEMLRDEFLEVRIADYKRTAWLNDIKTTFMFGAYVTWIVATTLLTTSLFVAQ